MIRFGWEDGGIPAVFAAVDSALARRMAGALAESWTDDTLNWIGAGRSFVSRHGGAGLEGGIGWRFSGPAAADVFVNKQYAEFVEFGTRPHDINPKYRKALKINSGSGGYSLRRFVRHPGSRPYHFFFADGNARQERMLEAARAMLASALAG